MASLLSGSLRDRPRSGQRPVAEEQPRECNTGKKDENISDLTEENFRQDYLSHDQKGTEGEQQCRPAMDVFEQDSQSFAVCNNVKGSGQIVGIIEVMAPLLLSRAKRSRRRASRAPRDHPPRNATRRDR